MDNHAQGALEYLLLIGGAVVVAVIVLTLLFGLAHSGQGEIHGVWHDEVTHVFNP